MKNIYSKETMMNYRICPSPVYRYVNNIIKNKNKKKYILLFIMLMAIHASGMSQDDGTINIKPNTQINQVAVEVWNDPAFQKQFAESYMAETEIEPRVTVDEREQMQKVLELIAAEKINEALALIKKELTRNNAASAVYDFTMANIYFQRDQFVDSVEGYTNAVTKYPKFRRAWKNIGLIYIRQGEFAKAMAALTKVMELGGTDAITYGLMGFAYSSIDNYLAAETAYRMAILLDPDTMDWKMGLARSLFKQERYAEAAALCSQLIEHQPDKPELWMLQANAYIGMNQPLRAAEIFELVDHLGKSTADSLNMLGDIYVNEDLYELAAKSYIRAMDADQEAGAKHALASAKVLAARGAFEETMHLIEHIETQYGEKLEATEHKEILKLHARLAVAKGASDEELRVLEEIVGLDPLDGEALILLGQNSARSGDNDKAIIYYERAAAIETFEAEAKVNAGQLLVRIGKYDEALPLLRRAQQLKPRENLQEYITQVERIAKSH